LPAALEAEISALKQLNQLLRDQLDDARGQRDKWEQAADGPASATRSERAYTLVVAETPCGMIGSGEIRPVALDAAKGVGDLHRRRSCGIARRSANAA